MTIDAFHVSRSPTAVQRPIHCPDLLVAICGGAAETVAVLGATDLTRERLTSSGDVRPGHMSLQGVDVYLTLCPERIVRASFRLGDASIAIGAAGTAELRSAVPETIGTAMIGRPLSALLGHPWLTHLESRIMDVRTWDFGTTIDFEVHRHSLWVAW